MSQVTDGSARVRHPAALMYGPIQDELAEVERILATELRSDHPFVDQLVRHGFRLGGKRLRPALLLLSAKATGEINRDHLVLAAVMEMIHTATLIHDDVLDEATLRRHEDTVNARWDNDASVLLGDYLFTHSFYLASTLQTTFACQTIGRATNIVCEGELRQIESRQNFALTESEYYGIVEAKTAELCACCCRLGAHYAGASRQTQESLARYGRALGVAFQIIDDVLDLEGDEATTGKSLGADLEQQKPTLPILHLLSQADAADRSDITAVLTRSGNHRRESLDPWLRRSDSLGYARAKAEEYATAAREHLDDLPENAAATILRQLTRFVVQRSR